MDIHDYEYIVAIAEQGSISRAAAQLFITQPALTKFLQRTERALGIALFLRKGNQFILTEAGQKYVDTGRAIMRLNRMLEEELTENLRNQKRLIRLGFSMGRTNEMLEYVLPAFYEAYPDIKVSLKADTSRRQMLDLQNRNMDLVMVTNVEKLPGYTYLPVEPSWLSLAVPEDSPLIAEAQPDKAYPYPVITLEQVKDMTMVSMSTSTNSGRLMKELCARHGFEIKSRLEVTDVRTLLEAVENGFGPALVMSVPTGARRIRYLSIKEMEIIEQTTELVYRSDLSLPPPMEYLIRLILDRPKPGQ